MTKRTPPTDQKDIKIEKSCGTLCFKKTDEGLKFLLLRYPEGHWDFPKGHVELNEDEKSTALRELYEETGIENAEILDGFREPLRYVFYADFEDLKGWIDKTVVYFLCESKSQENTVLSDEHNDFVWLNENETRAKITYDNCRAIFEKGILHLKLMNNLKEVARNENSALYELNNFNSVRRFILTTPESRLITNDPLCFGVRYTNALRQTMVKGFEFLKQANIEVATEEKALILNILRGGLNFGLREALFESYGWNTHKSSFLSSQRVYDQKDGWHITENRYQKIELHDVADIICADVVATGVSLKHALLHIIELAKEKKCQIRRIAFFTIGSARSEELIEEATRKCKEFFPLFEGAFVVYLEGIFGVANEKCSLRIAIDGTDLLRNPALMAPEFIDSQSEKDSFALERCTIYDAGSRAYDTHEYLSDVKDYWCKVLALGNQGISVAEYLKERLPTDKRLSDENWFKENNQKGSLASLATKVLSDLNAC